ncbi:hypothetical protein V6Z11_D08G142300 [Gossypium hirsutum]
MRFETPIQPYTPLSAVKTLKDICNCATSIVGEMSPLTETLTPHNIYLIPESDIIRAEIIHNISNTNHIYNIILNFIYCMTSQIHLQVVKIILTDDKISCFIVYLITY